MLRSWEKEFPDLGVTRSAGGPRFYRRADVERVLRIKQLVFSEGLTLSGARRRLEEERAGQPRRRAAVRGRRRRAPAGLPNARARIDEVKQGLRAILQCSGQLASPQGGTATAVARAPASGAAGEPLLPMDDPRPRSREEGRTLQARQRADAIEQTTPFRDVAQPG